MLQRQSLLVLLFLVSQTLQQNISIGFLGVNFVPPYNNSANFFQFRGAELGYRFGIARSQEILGKYGVNINTNVNYHSLSNLDVTVKAISMKEADPNLVAVIGKCFLT